MTEKERMLTSKLYIAKDKELGKEHLRAIKLLHTFNNSLNIKKRNKIMYKLFNKVGNNCYIEPPLRLDYGIHTSIGDNFYANFGLIILDVCNVVIGDNVFIGPQVSIFCAAHPITKEERNKQLEYGKPITIGSDVWIGGNTVICPGVKIGDDVVIGAGSVVVKDIPSGVVAAGNPCRVLRQINENDKKYWASKALEYEEDK